MATFSLQLCFLVEPRRVITGDKHFATLIQLSPSQEKKGQKGRLKLRRPLQPLFLTQDDVKAQNQCLLEYASQFSREDKLKCPSCFDS